MFGHDDKQKDDDQANESAGQVVQPAPAPAVDDTASPSPAAEPVNTPVSEPPAAPPVSDDDDDISKIVDDINASTSPEPEKEEPVDTDQPAASQTPPELMEVKKSALQELSPLLDELDQSAEEKLNILMMTIQATDDQALLTKALEQAKKIDDKKARAEAMLDIIQEVNYFTKKQ